MGNISETRIGVQVIKFGISWVARFLGVSGFTVQQPTTRGSLQDLNISARVVPFNPSNLANDHIHFHNDRKATNHLKRFQDTQVKLSQDSQVSDASNAFNELNERLVELEKIVQPEKKTDFQKLQGWVHSKRYLH